MMLVVGATWQLLTPVQAFLTAKLASRAAHPADAGEGLGFSLSPGPYAVSQLAANRVTNP